MLPLLGGLVGVCGNRCWFGVWNSLQMSQRALQFVHTYTGRGEPYTEILLTLPARVSPHRTTTNLREFCRLCAFLASEPARCLGPLRALSGFDHKLEHTSVAYFYAFTSHNTVSSLNTHTVRTQYIHILFAYCEYRKCAAGNTFALLMAGRENMSPEAFAKLFQCNNNHPKIEVRCVAHI